MNKRTAILQGLKLYALRLVVAGVFWIMAVAIERTNLQAGVATKYDAFGMDARIMRHYLSLALIIAAPMIILFDKWYVDLLTTVPFLLLFYFSILYYIDTHNLTAPTLYGSVWLLVTTVLWARKYYEYVS